jgi:hypothetical protein
MLIISNWTYHLRGELGSGPRFEGEDAALAKLIC